MKKITILSALLLCGTAAFAQQAVLKEAESAMKSKAPMTKVVEIIKPAFTNPETKDQAQTWYIPGKAAFEEYKNLFGLKAFGKLPADGQQTMGNNLIEGYNYFQKALALDSVPDAKGKIKTKYSKDIMNILVANYQDYNNNAIELFNEVKDYKGAYKAWDIYLEMSKDPVKYKGIQVFPDSTLSEINYNQAIAAWQYQDYKAALNSLLNAKALGYNKKNLYDLAIFAADNIGDTTLMISLCDEAQPLYGAEDTRYITYIINNYLTKKEYEKASAAIEKAIEIEPNNAVLYAVRGVILENQERRDDARVAYKKAVEIDPESPQANYYYGKSLCELAYQKADESPANPAEIDKYNTTVINPIFNEAVNYLEKAYDLDNNNLDALRYLENAYYNLKNEAMLKDVEKRLGK